MGLKEKRKKIQREIEDLAKSPSTDKVIRELKTLAVTIEDLLLLVGGVKTEESNIP